jgi:uncharacterized protein YciI
MDEEERIAQLSEKMLRKRFYVVLWRPLATAAELKPFLAAHLEYMIGLERRGAILASGPLADAEMPPKGEGLTVLRVESAKEAQRIVEAEPFYKNGLRTFELKEWTVMEGMLGLRVNFSDQTVVLA